eukprot:CAMPEP_0172708152 /NCGR_PEP_ID=MMETSP1074-20121228/50388_1 /TAXON_ID=2916 /ORGANISM="Ceratium fusus, Strain PA161109" /LENGTH=173 /DNA_ID=CAMNT_0013531049 /DNA_START=36 /DNA_END=557 /DNA_ORIENTATION=-
MNFAAIWFACLVSGSIRSDATDVAAGGVVCSGCKGIIKTVDASLKVGHGSCLTGCLSVAWLPAVKHICQGACDLINKGACKDISPTQCGEVVCADLKVCSNSTAATAAATPANLMWFPLKKLEHTFEELQELIHLSASRLGVQGTTDNGEIEVGTPGQKEEVVFDAGISTMVI